MVGEVEGNGNDGGDNGIMVKREGEEETVETGGQETGRRGH